jgi:hypothetical protein
VVKESSLPAELETSAFSLDGQIMGIRSHKLSLEGVQFHPESIATSQGKNIFLNFFSTYLGMRFDAGKRLEISQKNMSQPREKPEQRLQTPTGNPH